MNERGFVLAGAAEGADGLNPTWPTRRPHTLTRAGLRTKAR